MDQQQIIMNFTVPPSTDDLEVIAQAILDNMPEELSSYCEDIAVQIEDVADEALEDEFDLDDPFELVALYRKGSQISPGVQSKVANDDDVIIIFRRPLLDIWCESGEDITDVMRQAIIEELGANFDFSEDEIDDMTQRHYQGML